MALTKSERDLLNRVVTSQARVETKLEYHSADIQNLTQKVDKLDNSIRGDNGTPGLTSRMNTVENRLGIGAGIVGKMKGSLDPSAWVAAIASGVIAIWAAIRSGMGS